MGVFIGIVVQNNNLIKQEILSRAQSHFKQIVLTRRWNASYGGVLVEKTQGVVSNPYLENPDVRSCDGKIYTKKNPALMTREISEIAQKEGLFNFNITSLKPLNPNNIADNFEKDALIRFKNGEKEIFTTTDINGSSFFRYMAPLKVEKTCLQCHEKQGYKVGDIRGGISVTFNIKDIKNTMDIQRIIFILLGIITATLLIVIIYFMIMRLMNKLAEAYKKIEDQAIHDELTGLYNRRRILEIFNEEFDRSQRYNTPLTCVMIDIDYFKPINDAFGHLAGDEVLRHLSAWMKINCRKSDIVGRYGGEEFLIIIPDEKNSSANVAEKIRAFIENRKVEFDQGKTVSMTVSIGVASMRGKTASIENSDMLLKLADEALYRAKREGRNRVIAVDA
jgi:diguanylate cyclase (GGDEF)-like protein